MNAWKTTLGFFIENKLIVLILMGLLVFGGLYTMPFAWDSDFPRDPVPVDAIPDIGENQQIVFTEWPGRSPRDIEDQISYPLTTALLGIPGVRTVRSYSMFGFSSIYVIFEEGVEFYWSRSRVLEKLNSLSEGLLPGGVNPMLGPDATALGQVFWYTLEGHTPGPDSKLVGGWDLHELRSIQDWTVRYALLAVDGVAEVASVGGHVREYQIDVSPEALRANDISIQEVAKAVRESNLDVGARTMEINQIEYVIRGVGFVKNTKDLEESVVALRGETPLRIRDLARVSIGPKERRGILDKEGAEAVGGVVVARYGENPMAVLKRVHEKIAEISPGLPTRELEDGTVSKVKIVPFYDRSELIQETLDTLSEALWQQILVTIIVVLLLLHHLRSSILISLMLPLGVLGTFGAMKVFGIDANIMSLAGIAIAIGTMVDMGIVFTENIVEYLEKEPDKPRGPLIRDAAAEVAPAVLTSLLTTLVSFFPVFALTDAEGKLFTPVAYTKTFAMLAAFLFSVLVLPAAAHLIVWKAPENLEKRGVRALFHQQHFRDWVLFGAGVVLAFFNVWMGLFVILMAAVRFAIALSPARFKPWPKWIEIAVAVLAILWLLTENWMPLGWEDGILINLVFVGSIIFGLMGVFTVFLKVYPQVLRWTLDNKFTFLTLPALFVLFGLTAWQGFPKVFSWLPESVRTHEVVVDVAHSMPGFGREFMPPFDEGSFLVMPTTMPHASIGEAKKQLQMMGAAIKTIPEVEDVVGKLGRAESPLDPAPVSMYETVVTYKPKYRVEADGTRVRQWREHINTPEDIWQEIVAVAEVPGMTSAPLLQPINARIVMLQTGMRAPMGMKVRGPDLATIEKVGLALEDLLREVPGIRPETVFAERTEGKPYLEIRLKRESMARLGLSVQAVQDVIQVGVGGMPLTQTVEGRERYPVRVRYMREDRDSIEALMRLSVPTPSGAQVPLEQVAEIMYVRGPQSIKSEDTFLTGYVIFDKTAEVAEADVVERAQRFLQEKIDSGEFVLPAGVSYVFTGSYENQVRSEKRLKVLIPIALAVIFLLLYLQFRSTFSALIIYTGVVVAVSGGFILIWLYGQPWFLNFDVFGTSMQELFQVAPMNLSVAVWIGVIALVGIATDDGVVMSTYLKQQFDEFTPDTRAEIRARVLEAGLRRVRPCLLTTGTTLLALLPVVTSQGRGSDIMVPMAIPALGGMAIELVTLFIVPVLYCADQEIRLWWRQRNPLTELEEKDP